MTREAHGVGPSAACYGSVVNKMCTRCGQRPGCAWTGRAEGRRLASLSSTLCHLRHMLCALEGCSARAHSHSFRIGPPIHVCTRSGVESLVVSHIVRIGR